MKFKSPTHLPIAGFSLNELLVVVAIIGILTAILIPALTAPSRSSDEIKAERNAQTIADVASQARVAGAGEIDSAATPEQAVRKLIAGVKGKGSLRGMEFKISPLSDDEIQMSARHLHISSGMLCRKVGQ